jgi:hypothetical protein
MARTIARHWLTSAREELVSSGHNLGSGQIVSVAFPDGVAVEAKVMWIANGQTGLNFVDRRLTSESMDHLAPGAQSLAA